MNSPCHDEPMVEVNGTNCDECPKCHEWYIVHSGEIIRVI